MSFAHTKEVMKFTEEVLPYEFTEELLAYESNGTHTEEGSSM